MAILSIVRYPLYVNVEIPAPVTIEAMLNNSIAINGTINFTDILIQQLSLPYVVQSDPRIVSQLHSITIDATQVIQVTNSPTKAPSFDKSSVGLSNVEHTRNNILISVFSVIGLILFGVIALYIRNLLSRKRAAEITVWEDLDLQAEFGFLSYSGSELSSSSFDSQYTISDATNPSPNTRSSLKDGTFVDI